MDTHQLEMAVIVISKFVYNLGLIFMTYLIDFFIGVFL